MASNIADFLANELIDHFLRNTAYSPAAAVYVGLFTSAVGDAWGGTEVSGGAYIRKAITFHAAATRHTDNSALITFTEASALWGTVGWVGVHDAESAGDGLAWGSVTTPKIIDDGDTAKIAANALVFTFTPTP